MTLSRDQLLRESRTFLRYGLVGGFTVGVDFVVLFLLHGQAGVSLVLATTIAYAAALVVHYLLNRGWAFRAPGEHRRQLPRYLVIVGTEFAITLLLVVLLTDAGLRYLVAKLIAVVVTSAANFLFFRGWVFRGHQRADSGHL